MKLIDILKQELPKHGGWPDGVDSVCQSHAGEIEAIQPDGDCYSTGIFINGMVADNLRIFANTPGECGADVVTREQYEAATAPEWNGEGLPPVGTVCEVSYANSGSQYVKCTILAVTKHSVIVGYDVDEDAFKLDDVQFRPIRNKRDEAVDAIASLIGRGTFSEDAETIYDAIASGVILVDSASQ